MQHLKLRSGIVSAASLALVTGYANAQSVPPEDKNVLEQIVVTGTRVENRSALATAVPVDVISAQSLENTGTVEINQALSTRLHWSTSTAPLGAAHLRWTSIAFPMPW